MNRLRDASITTLCLLLLSPIIYLVIRRVRENLGHPPTPPKFSALPGSQTVTETETTSMIVIDAASRSKRSLPLRQK